MNKKPLKHKLSKAFEERHMAKPDIVADAMADTAIKTLEEIGFLEGELCWVNVHGRIEFYVKKEDGIYQYDYDSKKKKYYWHPTVMCPARIKKLKAINGFAGLLGFIRNIKEKK